MTHTVIAHDTPHRYRTLDGMRGIAALCVLIGHAIRLPNALFFHSYLAVDLFFALSGFVLCASYGDRLRDQSLSAVAFMCLRFIRFYPLFFLAAVMGFAAALLNFTSHGGQMNNSVAWGQGGFLANTVASFLFALLMLPSPFTVGLYVLNAPAWTMFYELIANFIFGAMRARYVFGGLGVASACVLIGYVCTGHGLYGGQQWGEAGIGLAHTLYSFCIGVILFHLRGVGRIRQSNCLALLALGLIPLLLCLPSVAGLDNLYDAALILVILPLLVLFASYIEPKSRALTVGCDAIGKASYGFYILQVPLSALIAVACAKVFGITLVITPVTILALATFLVATALLLDRYYDRPLQRWLKARTAHR